MNNLLGIKYNQSVTVDEASKNSICEICKKTAIYRCWVTGGPLHGKTGVFCEPCAEWYASHAERVSEEARARNKQVPEEQVYAWEAYHVCGNPLSEQGTMKAVRSRERYGEEITTLKYDEVCQIPGRHDGEIESWKDYNGWVSPTYPQ